MGVEGPGYSFFCPRWASGTGGHCRGTARARRGRAGECVSPLFSPVLIVAEICNENLAKAPIVALMAVVRRPAATHFDMLASGEMTTYQGPG